MNNKTNYIKQNRTAYLAHLEQERQEWLAAGMSEADIFRIHFGEYDENGNQRKNGYFDDYAVWLSERKHTRSDHKYAPGTPVAIDAVDPDGAWISGGRGGLNDVEFNIDFETALSKLTELQRFCFIEVIMKAKTQQSVANDLEITQQMVVKHINAAQKKLKIFFEDRL